MITKSGTRCDVCNKICVVHWTVAARKIFFGQGREKWRKSWGFVEGHLACIKVPKNVTNCAIKFGTQKKWIDR